MRHLGLLLLLLLPACAQQPPAPVAGVFVGRSEADLVSTLGVPNRVIETDGRRLLAYDGAGAARPVVVPSIGIGVGRFGGGWGSGTAIGTGAGISFGGAGVAEPCTTIYEVRDGQVIGASQQGPGCG